MNFWNRTMIGQKSIRFDDVLKKTKYQKILIIVSYKNILIKK